MYGDATPDEVIVLQEYIAFIKAMDLVDRSAADVIPLYEAGKENVHGVELLNTYFYEVIEAEKDLTQEHKRSMAEVVQLREKFYNYHQGDMFNEVGGLRNDMMRENLENQPTNGKEYLVLDPLLVSIDSQ